MGKEYIEREAALALLKDEREVCADSKAELKYIRADIRAIPAADVRPVVRGKWIDEPIKRALGIIVLFAKAASITHGTSAPTAALI